jgi:hypothetical protein
MPPVFAIQQMRGHAFSATFLILIGEDADVFNGCRRSYTFGIEQT